MIFRNKILSIYSQKIIILNVACIAASIKKTLVFCNIQYAD